MVEQDDSAIWMEYSKGLPVPAWLNGQFLYYKDPTGHNSCTMVTRKPTYSTASHHVWHIDIAVRGNQLIATVSPSIWHHGRFHTPNPVEFLLLTEEEWNGGR